MVSAVELGQQPPTGKYLELVDRALETGGLFGRMSTELVSLDKAQVWLRGWRAILAEARALRWFDPLHVPGLLQTEGYARAIFESDRLLDADEVERRLTDRMDSQQVLYADRPPHLVAVLDESVLRRRVGGRKMMCEQAVHLARLATEHPRAFSCMSCLARPREYCGPQRTSTSSPPSPTTATLPTSVVKMEVGT